MRYFKIIVNNVIIGVITSNDFMRYLPITDCFIRANEQSGEYATYKGKFYRSGWMVPIQQQADYIEAEIINITEEEYNIYQEAFTVHETIAIEEAEEEEEDFADDPYVDPIGEISIQFIRDTKLMELSRECRRTIEAGFDLELRGEIKHFSLDTQDQLNLMSLGLMAQTQSLIPYHADGEECVFYTNEEINEIVDTANAFKIYHTTYYNSLKVYVNALDTLEAISAVEYGDEIPEQYQTDVLKALS